MSEKNIHIDRRRMFTEHLKNFRSDIKEATQDATLYPRDFISSLDLVNNEGDDMLLDQADTTSDEIELNSQEEEENRKPFRRGSILSSLKQIRLKKQQVQESLQSSKVEVEEKEKVFNNSIDSKINENGFYDIEIAPHCEGQTETDDGNIDNRHLIRGQKMTLIRSQGVRNLNEECTENNSITQNMILVRSQGTGNLNVECIENNSITLNERSSLSKFVQNMSRRISGNKELSEDHTIAVSNNSSETNIECDESVSYHEGGANSLRFYYNFDLDDNPNVGEITNNSDNYEEELPEIFKDGNFELVDGLIVFVEKPVRKNSEFLKGSILFQRGIKGQSCQVKKELKSRAA